MATYELRRFCECGHMEKKHNNKGRCLDYTPWPIEHDNVTGQKPCHCKHFTAALE